MDRFNNSVTHSKYIVKNNKASDPMTQAPSLVADKQLEELALHVDLENE